MDRTTIAMVALCGAFLGWACGSDDASIPDGSADGTTGMVTSVVDTGGQQDTSTTDTGTGADGGQDGSNPADGSPGDGANPGDGAIKDGNLPDINLPDVGKG